MVCAWRSISRFFDLRRRLFARTRRRVRANRVRFGLGFRPSIALSGDAVAPLVAATTCYELGADDLTVQRILRHGSVQVTREKYIKLKHGKMDAAMDSLTRARDGQNQVGPRSGPNLRRSARKLLTLQTRKRV
jgi:integrase